MADYRQRQAARVIYDKDRDEDEPKQYTRKKKPWDKKPQRVYKESLTWLEHKAILAKAGIRVDEPFDRRGRR